MKYMLLIYGNEEAFSSVGAETFAEIVRETDALNQELFESGELVGAYGVADQVNAKMVRATAGTPVVTDGPYAEAKEYLGSFTIVDCDSLERALEIAARNPSARYWGVEVRPLMHEANVEPRPTGGPSGRWSPRCSVRWCAATVTSTPARTPCRRRC